MTYAEWALVALGVVLVALYTFRWEPAQRHAGEAQRVASDRRMAAADRRHEERLEALRAHAQRHAGEAQRVASDRRMAAADRRHERLEALRAHEQGDWLERAKLTRLMLHTTDDRSISGLVVEVGPAGVLLRSAQLLGEFPVDLAGEVWLPRSQLAFAQSGTELGRASALGNTLGNKGGRRRPAGPASGV